MIFVSLQLGFQSILQEQNTRKAIFQWIPSFAVYMQRYDILPLSENSCPVLIFALSKLRKNLHAYLIKHI